MDLLKNQFQKIYLLTFNKETSLYKQEEVLPLANNQVVHFMLC